MSKSTKISIEKMMKSYRKELWLNVPSRRGFINITPDVETALRESGIREGLILINHNHITASIQPESRATRRKIGAYFARG